MDSNQDYSDGLADGVQICLDLVRSGASVDEIEAALPAGDPADLDQYHAHLRELRAILGADCPALFER